MISQRKLLEADLGDPSLLFEIQIEGSPSAFNHVACPEHTEMLRKSDTTACRWSPQQTGQCILTRPCMLSQEHMYCY